MRGSAQIVFAAANPTALRAAWQGLFRPVHPDQNTSVGKNVSSRKRVRVMTHGSEKRARDKHLTIRLTSDERARIEADAERAGLMTGSYARRALLGASSPRQVRRPMVERKLLARLLGELGHIGSNLNQIARDANMGAGVDRVGLGEYLRDLRRLRDGLLEALGRSP